MKKLFVCFLTMLTVPLFAQQFTLNGSAFQLSCPCYRLTQAINTQFGSVWNNNTIDLNNSFDYRFQVYLGCNDGGADGMVFGLQPIGTSVGAPGGGMGFGGVSPSIGIELDTYQNGSPQNDPFFDHIALNSNGSVSHNLVAPIQASSTTSNIEDCVYHDLRVVWNATTQTITAYFDGVFRFSYTFPAPGLIQSVFGGNPTVYWGFSAGTGALNNEHRFCVSFNPGFMVGNNYRVCGRDNVLFTDSSSSYLGNILSWNWNFGDASTSNLRNPVHTYANAGQYNVNLQITDQSGCQSNIQQQVTIYDTISIAATVTDPDCNGAANGSIALTPSGGATPYTYTWTGGLPATALVSNLGPGSYSVTVSDPYCSSSASYAIAEPPALAASLSVVPVRCFGNADGTARISVSGGTPPYTFNWSGGTATDSIASSLTSGNYSVTVNDANSCQLIQNFTVNGPAQALSVSLTPQNPVCNGALDGSIQSAVTGGTAPYRYLWNTADTLTGLTGIGAGVYSVVVTDSNGCLANANVSLTDPLSLQITNTAVDPLCNGSNDGSISVVVSNANGSITYLWSPTQPDAAQITALSAGTYLLTVTDALGCTATTSVSLADPALLQLSLVTTPPACSGVDNGTVNFTPSGGTGTYTYDLQLSGTSIPVINDAADGLSAGSYTGTITDANGCQQSFSFALQFPTPVALDIRVDSIRCAGAESGGVQIIPLNGIPPYVFVLNGDSSTVNRFDGLAPGNYQLQMIDSVGCSADTTFDLDDAIPLTLTIDPADTIIGLTATLTIRASASGSGLVYQWQPVQGLSCSDCPTPDFVLGRSVNYLLTVTDQWNCKITGNSNIVVRPEYQLFFPNAFSPDADGNNDVFQVYGNYASIAQFRIQIFNRTGEKVFEATSANFNWDGTYRGKPVPPGAYVYIAKATFIDSHTEDLFKGTITILR